ncbi:phospholipase A and acyltransferase 1-like [Vipera latastei]
MIRFNSHPKKKKSLQFGAFPDGLPSVRYYDQAETGIKKDVEHVFQNGDIPKPGDMIQFQMVLPYQHWGIYVGNGEVVHFTISPFDTSPFRVHRAKITDVLGVLKSAVWNKFDQKYPPLDPARVVKRALHMENKVPRYNLATANCEHFATLMRYDKALSDQAERFNFTVDRDFEQEIRRCLAEVDCGSGECLSTFQKKVP